MCRRARLPSYCWSSPMTIRRSIARPGRSNVIAVPRHSNTLVAAAPRALVGLDRGRRVQGRSRLMPNPNGEQRKPDRYDIGAYVEPLAALHEFLGLQTECRKRRVAATEADHDGLADYERDHEPALARGQHCKEPDNE